MSAFSPRQMFKLDEAYKPIVAAFEETPYLVGSSVERTLGRRGETHEYRDVDVRLMLDNEKYTALRSVGPHVIELLGITIGEYLAQATGMTIDFQIQHADIANEKYRGMRNPLGLRHLSNYRGDAHPEG